MQIILNNLQNEHLEVISLEDLDNIDKTFKKFSLSKGPLKAKMFAINEFLSSHQLSEFKKKFEKINVFSMSIYSNVRDTIIAGKSLKIDSTFLKEQEAKNKLFLINPKNKDDILHEGTVRSGDKISSNGNLCIIGDVNPGAMVSAKKNIYVWGKLLGIALAGDKGDNNAFIAALYLNPLQLRISNVIAIGPKDKPKNYYPEIAVIDNQTINIKPYIIGNNN